MSLKEEQRSGNTGLAKVAVHCSADTFVVNKVWFSASTFVVKIATFAKPEIVSGNFAEPTQLKLMKETLLKHILIRTILGLIPLFLFALIIFSNKQSGNDFLGTNFVKMIVGLEVFYCGVIGLLLRQLHCFLRSKLILHT